MRIAEVVYNTSKPDAVLEKKDRYLANVLDQLAEDSAMTSSTDTLTSLSDQNGDVNAEEKRILDKVGGGARTPRKGQEGWLNIEG